ncbi:hypothetical protein HT585_31090 [Ensifer sp. HO-A22]|uniref:Uncharacterized protein n=1 Tax=Ensifer oleiphilus TaxID=2742698 RepID=A0A7Y6QDC3_9HYPH|nr:hypothetical protein [Ensifer oleiphilus]NVD43315.1 hypothetical protein [Ensifer oleiphilus]
MSLDLTWRGQLNLFLKPIAARAQLLFVSGKRPIMAGKLVYYSYKEFADLFDPG